MILRIILIVLVCANLGCRSSSRYWAEAVVDALNDHYDAKAAAARARAARQKQQSEIVRNYSEAILNMATAKALLARGVQVYLSPAGRVYHTATCSYLSRPRVSISLTEVQVLQYYEACSVCIHH